MKKIVLSVLLSFIALTAISFFYYNVPVHKRNESGATDYVWDKNAIYIRADEGIGFGKTNNQGLMNIDDYNDKVDILVMGSSHFEGQAIPLSYNLSSLLNEELSNIITYNISVSGHSFKVVINNLDDALKIYRPNYVVIEISNLYMSDSYIENILNSNIKEISSNSNKLIDLLQRNPFLRLAYTQINKFKNNDDSIDETYEINKEFKMNTNLNDKLLKYIKNIANKYNTEVILLYHPYISIDSTGNMIFLNNDANNNFSKLCNNNDIYFIDMSQRFLLEYEKSFIIPKGFMNTAICSGHLNVDGHRMIADEIEQLIRRIYK